jgi:hypothetical protein
MVDEFTTGRPRRVKGVVLFATPNNGAEMATIGDAFSWFHPQMRQLRKESDLLERLNDDWSTMSISKYVPARYVLGSKDRVVDRASAKGFPGNPETETILDKGHINIVKPKNKDDDAVLIVKRFLKTLQER